MTTERIDIVVSERGARTARRNIEDIGRGAQGAQGAVQLLRRALGALGLGLAAREVLRLSDTYTNLQNRLRTVTDNTVELTRVTEDLFKVANETRATYEGTVEIFTRSALAAKELGVAQSELIEFTRSLNQAVILSGASAQEANNALIQLSQGIASGTLRGDELRSVLEQLPVVADVIAKQLGVTRGQLRLLGQEGKITAKDILLAFRAAREELAERFAETVPTISQSFTVLRNNFIKFIGDLDNGLGATRSLSRAILSLANNLDLVAKALAGVLAGFIALALPTLIRQFTALAKAAALLSIRLAGLFAGAAVAGFAILLARAASNGRTLAEELEAVRTELSQFADEFVITDDVTKAIEDVKDVYKSFGNTLVDTSKIGRDSVDEVKAAIKRLEGALELLQGAQFRSDIFSSLGLDVSNPAEVIKEIEGAITRLAARLKELEGLKVDVTPSEELKRQQELLEEIQGPFNEYIANVRSLNTLLAANKITSDEFKRTLRDLRIEFLETQTDAGSGFERAFLKIARDAEDMATQIEKVVTNAFRGMEDALVEFVKTGKLDFKSLVDSIITDIIRLVIRAQIVAPLAQIINGFVGGLFGSGSPSLNSGAPGFRAGQADGGVWSGGVQAFANGGIINQPTAFGMSAGRLGLMGEAGPEAILPVTRIGQRLGVDATGVAQGTIVQIFDQRTSQDSEPVETEETQGSDGRRVLKIMIRDTVNREIQQGAFDGAMRDRFGNNVSTVRR